MKIEKQQLYMKISGSMYKLVHASEYARLKGTTENAVRKRREYKKLEDDCVYIKNGYYFFEGVEE